MLDTENGHRYREIRVASKVSTEKEKKKAEDQELPHQALLWPLFQTAFHVYFT